MLRIFLSLILFSSCSLNTIKSGGEKSYVYNSGTEYTKEDLQELAGQVVETQQRDPHIGKLKALFGKKQPPLKRVGIIVFETQIQPTLEGLAGHNQIYVSESGKQIMSESFLSIWEQSLKLLAPDLDYVPTSQIKKSLPFHQYGLPEENFVKTQRTSLAPDDIFYLEKGKKTTTTTTVNPRGMRDVSFLLVPAYELMEGPKWSEHNKHFVNEVVKDLKLDAAIIVMSEASWTAAHTDKHSGEFIPEEVKIKLKSSVLIPIARYHERLKNLHINEKPNLTVAYRSYEAFVKTPALISVPEDMKRFDTIEQELLNPLFKTYKDLSQMMIMKMVNDFQKTW